MLTTQQVVFALRGLLVLAFVAIVLLQVMSVPGTLAYKAEQSADPFWRWRLLVVLEVELVCAQVVDRRTWSCSAWCSRTGSSATPRSAGST